MNVYYSIVNTNPNEHKCLLFSAISKSGPNKHMYVSDPSVAWCEYRCEYRCEFFSLGCEYRCEFFSQGCEFFSQGWPFVREFLYPQKRRFL